MTEQEILDAIHEWKSFWMNQTQNSEADQKNYFSRALGVDANMTHHLAKLLAGKLKNVESELWRLQHNEETQTLRDSFKSDLYEELLAKYKGLVAALREIAAMEEVAFEFPGNGTRYTVKTQATRLAKDALEKWEKS